MAPDHGALHRLTAAKGRPPGASADPGPPQPSFRQDAGIQRHGWGVPAASDGAVRQGRALIIIAARKPGADRRVGVTAGRRPGRMPGPSTREGKPAVGTPSSERARAPATARVANGYRPWRWIPVSCRNDVSGGRTYDQGPRRTAQVPQHRTQTEPKKDPGEPGLGEWRTLSVRGIGARSGGQVP